MLLLFCGIQSQYKLEVEKIKYAGVKLVVFTGGYRFSIMIDEVELGKTKYTRLY